MKAIFLQAFLVGLGGFLGALCRYALAGVVHRGLPHTTFPVGTLAVNLLGCLLIGYLAGLADSRQLFSPELRLFAFIGLLGGFTTFSTFAYETLSLAQDAEFVKAVANTMLQVVLGFAAAFLGMAAARSL